MRVSGERNGEGYRDRYRDCFKAPSWVTYNKFAGETVTLVVTALCRLPHRPLLLSFPCGTTSNYSRYG